MNAADTESPVILAELIGEGRVYASLAVADKAGLLAELGRRSAAALGLDAAVVRSSLEAREALGSTGVGAGIALPHARQAGLSTPVGFFARLERAIDFAAIDQGKIDLVFLLLSPVQASASHLASLAAVARQLRRPEIVKAIRAAGSAAAIRAVLVDAG